MDIFKKFLAMLQKNKYVLPKHPNTTGEGHLAFCPETAQSLRKPGSSPPRPWSSAVTQLTSMLSGICSSSTNDVLSEKVKWRNTGKKQNSQTSGLSSVLTTWMRSRTSDLSERGVRHSELVPFPSYHVRIIGDVSWTSQPAPQLPRSTPHACGVCFLDLNFEAQLTWWHKSVTKRERVQFL